MRIVFGKFPPGFFRVSNMEIAPEPPRLCSKALGPHPGTNIHLVLSDGSERYRNRQNIRQKYGQKIYKVYNKRKHMRHVRLFQISHDSCAFAIAGLYGECFVLRTNPNPLETITCPRSYPTIIRIPSRFPTTTAIVSGLTLLLVSSDLSFIIVSRWFTNAGYFSSSTFVIFN